MGGETEQGGALVVAAEAIGAPAEITGSADARLAGRIVSQLAEALWLPAGLSAAEQRERMEAALAALKGLAPRDELEGLLAAQMVATHGAAMDCLRRAMRAEAVAQAREADLRQAGRLLTLYARPVETLDRHRGKGPQRVTVEHVRVERGGQAIVGHVSHSDRR